MKAELLNTIFRTPAKLNRRKAANNGCSAWRNSWPFCCYLFICTSMGNLEF